MKQSTTKFIAYNLRPAKQAERRILLDFLKAANDGGRSTTEYRYVGMGGTTFYDFHLVHRFLGIHDMVSLERDPDAYPRCAFNCPFNFISVRKKTAAEFLATDKSRKRTIYWFDYDDGIGPDITADIISLGTRVQVGGFAFVTVYAEPPGALEKQTPEQRLEYFQTEMGEFSVGLTAADMEKANFPKMLCQVLVAAFRNSFSARTDGQFEPIFQIQYKDSAWMITVGGFFCRPEAVAAIKARVEVDLPFLLASQPYKIRHLNLTERERVLLDIAVTGRTMTSRAASRLRSLGFRKPEFDAYRELIRFWPRYHEAII